MNKIQVTAQQRANALEALNVMWPSVPEGNVMPRLKWWRGNTSADRRLKTDAPPTCGTIACFGGWCAWWPSFVAQGVVCSDQGAPFIKGRDGYEHIACRPLFGDGEIFTPRGYGHPADVGFTGTDHELVSNRLRWLIENSEVVG